MFDDHGFQEIEIGQLDNDIVTAANGVVFSQDITKADIGKVLQNNHGESILYIKVPSAPTSVLSLDAKGNPIWNLGL